MGCNWVQGNGLWVWEVVVLGFADRDIEVDWPNMFSHLMVLLALGLYDITVGLGSLADNGPWYVFLSAWDLNSTS